MKTASGKCTCSRENAGRLSACLHIEHTHAGGAAAFYAVITLMTWVIERVGGDNAAVAL